MKMNLWKQSNTQEKENVTFICLEFSNANTINIYFATLFKQVNYYEIIYISFLFLFYFENENLGFRLFCTISDDEIMKKMSWFCEN